MKNKIHYLETVLPLVIDYSCEQTCQSHSSKTIMSKAEGMFVSIPDVSSYISIDLIGQDDRSKNG